MDVKSILRKNNFTFEKKYGQNFLTDFDLLGRVVEKSGVNENSTVIEIGVGAGTLTYEIAKRVKKVYGFEIDTKLKPILSETLGEFDNVEIIFKDISTGASNDIQQATKLARKMVTEYGMSEKLGFVNLSSDGEVFIGKDYQQTLTYSQETAKIIDEEMFKDLIK